MRERHAAQRHPRAVIGENRTFLGEEELLPSRGVEVQEVVQDPACIALMERFIAQHPAAGLASRRSFPPAGVIQRG